MKDNDKVLDKIVAHLRSEPVPEMPTELTVSRTAKPRRWVWYTAAASAIAASVVGYLLWHPRTSQTLESRMPTVVQHQRNDSRESDVIVKAVDLAEPFAQLEAKLVLMDAEIADLRKKAALLDVQRIADELLAQY